MLFNLTIHGWLFTDIEIEVPATNNRDHGKN
jgi:hypothetical protein